MSYGVCMRRWLALAGSALLAGCWNTPRDLALAGLDLGSPAVIAQLSKDLPQKERAAFATYALLHWPESKAYCGRPMFSGGGRPATVGEAVDRTLEFESSLARKRAAEKEAPSVFEQRARHKQNLVDEFDRLTIERDKLTSEPRISAESKQRIEALDKEMEANRAARNRLVETATR